jgi:hypothetical protein
LLIFRWRIKTRFSKTGEGTFQCDHCKDTQPYVQQVSKRWFVAYGIPLFPVSGVKSEQVRCETCKNTFTTEALGQAAAVQPAA